MSTNNSDMSAYFWSNCMIEAMKHKLKNWNGIKLTYIPCKYNEVFCPHFLWSDGEYDYDFGVDRYLRWWERFWFKGEIRQKELGFNEKWKRYRVFKCEHPECKTSWKQYE